MKTRGPRVNSPKERERRRLADYRKAAMVARGHVYNDLARLADVTFSMAEKWMNARRASEGCAEAFEKLTGKSARPETERAA